MSHQSELIATDIDAYLAQHEQKELLRFLTCGSVDDGKSTLIGRIDRLIEPSPRGDGISYIPFDPSAPATLYVAAYEYQMLPNLALTPNVVVIDYDRAEDGYQAATDLHLRLTAFFTF